MQSQRAPPNSNWLQIDIIRKQKWDDAINFIAEDERPEGHDGLLDSWEGQKIIAGPSRWPWQLPDNTHELRQAPAQGGEAARDHGRTSNRVEALASTQSTYIARYEEPPEGHDSE